MDLSPTGEQQALIDSFAALYSKESSTARVLAAEPGGFDADLWRILMDVGVVEMAVGETAGGAGGSLLDLALVAEQQGRNLAPAPVIEAQVAARLLSRVGTPRAMSLLEGALAGDELVTLALHPKTTGVLPLVPAGSVATTVVCLEGNRLLAVETADSRTPVANLGCLPVADVEVVHTSVLSDGSVAAVAYEEAIDEWIALTAGALCGLASRALEIGVDYVKKRHAFGVAIGSFQAVAHGLADAATAVEGGTLLAREAAWASGEDHGRFRELASLAFGFTTEAAREASYRSLHYHGGYGFMLEYDIQLYFRRAKAWPAQFAEPDVAFSRAESARLSPGGN